jgi:hypothetical protein
MRKVFNLANQVGGIAYCIRKRHDVVGMGVYGAYLNGRESDIVIEEGDSIEYCDKMLIKTLHSNKSFRSDFRLNVWKKTFDLTDIDFSEEKQAESDAEYDRLLSSFTTAGIRDRIDKSLIDYCEDHGVYLEVMACVGSYSMNIIASKYKVNYHSHIVAGKTIEDMCEQAWIFINKETPQGIRDFGISIFSQLDLQQESESMKLPKMVHEDHTEESVRNMMKVKEPLADTSYPPYEEWLRDNFGMWAVEDYRYMRSLASDRILKMKGSEQKNNISIFDRDAVDYI